MRPSSETIFDLWKRFINGQDPKPERLNAEVENAWRRCRAANVDPFIGRQTRALSAAELARLRERHKSLIAVARPFMDSLMQFVASSSFVVLLADERGYILETAADLAVLRAAPDLNFDPGALWSEDEIGNNGVGTALYLRRPFQVSGGEHYCRKHHPWTCSGAPIEDENGELIGVLEMSGPVLATHLHTLGMVVAAAEAIKQQLRVERRNKELTVLNNRLSNLFLSVSDGVVVLDGNGRIEQVNPVAEKILAARAATLSGRAFAKLLDKPESLTPLLTEGLPFTDQELSLKVSNEATDCLASAKPIRDESGALRNYVLFLNPLRRINKLINRFSGAHATFSFNDILGQAAPLTRAIEQGIRAAGTESNVLLRGESGTGKEMFAQAIHNRSDRRQGPFIAVNCGAIPRELIGSELFGYDEGAFTGAVKRGRPGKFELAAGGTLFLDEIGDMPLDQQVSLLRVLQDKAVTRIGGEKVLLVDVRIICATNKDLAQEIARGNFRQDLYYRLNIVSIMLPPLRELKSDIPLLFKTFHERICRKLGLPLAPVDPTVIERLKEHDWPGNMREFQNVVEKLVSLPGQEPIGLGQLPEDLATPMTPRTKEPPPREVLSLKDERRRIKTAVAQEERQAILNALATHHGNLSEAARALGLSRSSLYRKLAALAPAAGR